MSNLKKLINYSFISPLLILAFFTLTSSVSAESDTKKVIKIEKRISRLQKKLERKFTLLDLSKQAKVVNSRSGKSEDSDLDGVPDNLDSGRCDSDSDNDGIEDGDEYKNGTSPSDEDSDDDGFNDADEFKDKDTIDAKADTSLTVGGVLYLVSKSTEFLNDETMVNLAFFDIGECVEVEGHTLGSDLILEKVKLEDDC